MDTHIPDQTKGQHIRGPGSIVIGVNDVDVPDRHARHLCGSTLAYSSKPTVQVFTQTSCPQRHSDPLEDRFKTGSCVYVGVWMLRHGVYGEGHLKDIRTMAP